MDKEEIKNAVSMHDVLGRYGFNPNKAGFICCPFHKEKTASLKIYPKTNSFYCWGCHVGGDIFKFVMLMEDCDFNRAFEILGGTHDHKPMDNATALKLMRMKNAQKARETKRHRLNDEYIKSCDQLRYYKKAIEYAPKDSEIYSTAIKSVDYLEEKITELFDELARKD